MQNYQTSVILPDVRTIQELSVGVTHPVFRLSPESIPLKRGVNGDRAAKSPLTAVPANDDIEGWTQTPGIRRVATPQLQREQTFCGGQGRKRN